MKYKFEYTRDFKKDIKYIRKRLKNYYPHTYQKFFKNLFLKLELLKNFPTMYQIYKPPNKRRIVLMYNYILIYEFQNNTVYISKILNSKQSQDNK